METTLKASFVACCLRIIRTVKEGLKTGDFLQNSGAWLTRKTGE
jgi:hypothetical protein